MAHQCCGSSGLMALGERIADHSLCRCTHWLKFMCHHLRRNLRELPFLKALRSSQFFFERLFGPLAWTTQTRLPCYTEPNDNFRMWHFAPHSLRLPRARWSRFLLLGGCLKLVASSVSSSACFSQEGYRSMKSSRVITFSSEPLSFRT